jgi:glycerophosphoryl diester phosphodiesterase
MLTQTISSILILLIVWVIAIKPRSGNALLEELRQYHYAHRGYHNKTAGVPENSMAAFRRAVKNGWGAELDVRLTAAGRLAVIHDSKLGRVCGEGANVCVEDMTSLQLEQYRLEGTEEKIPSLRRFCPV